MKVEWMSARDKQTGKVWGCHVRVDSPYEGADRNVLFEVMDYALPEGEIKSMVDVGAHIGSFTCWIRSRFPECRILAIEPNEDNELLLALNTHGMSGIEIIDAAVSSEYFDTMALHIEPLNSGGHRVVPVDFPGEKEYPVGLSLAECITYSDVLPSEIDLLKIDCEGCEIDVFTNTPDEVLKTIKFITGERHVTSEEFMHTIGLRLQSLGFEVYDTPHPVYSAPPWNMKDRGNFWARQKPDVLEQSIVKASVDGS